MTEIQRLKQQLSAVQAEILRKPNVVGVGVGEKRVRGRPTGETVFIVLVSRKVTDLAPDARVPPMIDGVKTDVIEVGEVIPLTNTTRVRPAPGGVSIGNGATNLVGTLGYALRTEADSELYVLSNNHVIALANNAAFGDVIRQPSAGDGGSVAENIGTLYRFPLLGDGQRTDCAVARVAPGPLVIPAVLDGFSAARSIEGWFGGETQGGGIAVADVSRNGQSDLVVFHIDNPGGENRGYYRIGWNLDTNWNVTGGWKAPVPIPGWFGVENQGGGVAVADLDGDGRPELIVFYIDNPGGENRGYYRIGWALDRAGNVTGGWTDPVEVRGWFGAESQGGGVAVADLDGDGKFELIVFHIDNAGGENRGYYRIGWRLENGVVSGSWTNPITIPGWFGAESQGGGVAVADINSDGKPELVVLHIDNPGGDNTAYYRFGTLGTDGTVDTWVGPRQVAGWIGGESQAASVALARVSPDVRPDIVAFHIDNPSGENRGYYRTARSLWPNLPRWGANVRSTAQAVIGSRVWKSGRTSELTNSLVVAVGVTLSANYVQSANPGLGSLSSNEQILFMPGAKPGDSGSLLVDSDANAIGLVFYGSDVAAFANTIENVFEALRFSDARRIPDWFGNESQGGDIAAYDISNNGRPDLVVFHVDNPSGENHGHYRVGWNLDGNGIVRGGWTAPMAIPKWFGNESQGGGVAVADLNGDGRPELVVLHIDNPSGANRGHYRVGWTLNTAGKVTSGWSDPIAIPGWFGNETQGAGVAVADLNGDGRPELIVFHIDNPGGENRGYYRIGWHLGTNGIVQGGWSAPIAIPGPLGSENQGGGVAVVNLGGRPSLVVFYIDNPGGENHGYYRVGRHLGTNGQPQDGWSAPIVIPGWFGNENQGGGVAVTDLTGNGRPDLLVFHIDNPPDANTGYYRVVYDLMPNGQPARWYLA